MVEDAIEPALIPPSRDELFQLTVWVAVDPAYKENGCLRVLPGTQKKIATITFGDKNTKDGFYNTRYTIDHEIRDEDMVYLPAEPGQAIIFSERTIHGSPANETDNSRSAFNLRVIRPDTTVYKDKTFHRATHMDQTYKLDNWGCVLLRGRNEPALNPLTGCREFKRDWAAERAPPRP